MTIYKQMEYQMRLPEYEMLAEGKDGGLTFSGKLHSFDGLWFGWDYAHAGDFTFPFTMTGDKRWSTQEIVDECLRAIEQFRSFEEK